MDSMLEDFLAFAKSKPADEEYNACEPTACALAQFVTHSGTRFDRLHDDGWFYRGKFHEYDLRAYRAAIPRPWTFGALTERLNAALSQTKG